MHKLQEAIPRSKRLGRLSGHGSRRRRESENAVPVRRNAGEPQRFCVAGMPSRNWCYGL